MKIKPFSAIPHFIKGEHNAKVKFYDHVFNKVFGVTVKTLTEVVQKSLDKDLANESHY